MTTAVLYARHSPRPGAECDSCQKQLERERAYCQAMGWEVAAEEKDESMSGDDPGREGFERALEAACKLRAVFVVYDLTRFARDARLSLEMWDRLGRAKAHFAAVSEGVNTTSSTGKAMTKLVFTILAGMAEFQLSQIRERTSKAMLHYQKNGRRMGRMDRCPYGKMPNENGPMLEKEDKKTGKKTALPAELIDNPEEQATIEQIRRLGAVGLGPNAIVRTLNAQGVACRGHRWHYSTVRAILCRSGQVAAAS